MLTSVIVIAGTGRPYLRHALSSLVAQDAGDWEAIVVEACAEAADTAAVHRQIDEVTDPRIRVFPFDGWRGYPPYASRKWNFALKHAQGDLIAFLDDDDMKEGNWIGAMRAPLLADPNLSTTVCNGTNIDKNGARGGALFGQPSLDYITLIRGSFITTGQLVVRRRTIDAVSGFDEELSCAEDYDFALRLAAHPWQIVHSTKTLKRDSGDNACYNAGGYTQEALRRIIAKHGVQDICHGCGKDNTDFVWCVPGLGFRNWHYGCTGLKPGA